MSAPGSPTPAVSASAAALRALPSALHGRLRCLLPNLEGSKILVPYAAENRIELADKWRPGEVGLQWVFLLGCYALRDRPGPFAPASNSGILNRLLLQELGAKGVFSFAEHGFTSRSFLERFCSRTH